MASAQLCELLPSPWPDLLVILTSATNLKSDPLTRAELWWLQVTESSNSPGWLCWSEFIDALTLEQPTIKDNELIFCPTFYQAPAFLQVYILAFICRHRKEISASALNRFLRMLRVACDQCLEKSESSRHDVYIRLLSEYCAAGRQSHDSIASNVDLSPRLDDHAIISQREVMMERDSEFGTGILIEPPIAMDEKEPPDELVVIPMEECLSTVTVEDESMLRDRACKLKELWQNGTAEVNDDYFLSLAPSQLAIVLGYIDLASLQDVALTTACRTVSAFGQNISVQSCTIFAHDCLLSAVQRLVQPASRLLINGFVTFATAHPSVLIRSVFGPLLASTTSTSAQTDIVVRVIKEAFSVQHQMELLSLICAQCLDWTDGILLIIQSVIELKVELTPSLLGELVISADANAHRHAGNLKYGKLLLAVINIYGPQLSEMQRGQICRSAELHKTFMKKSILSMLSKLEDT